MSRKVIERFPNGTRIIRDSEYREYIVVPRGKKASDDAAYFSDNLEDARGTARHMDTPSTKNPVKKKKSTKEPSPAQIAARKKFAENARARARINKDLETRPGYGTGAPKTKKKARVRNTGRPGNADKVPGRAFVIQFEYGNGQSPKYYAGMDSNRLHLTENLSDARYFATDPEAFEFLVNGLERYDRPLKASGVIRGRTVRIN